MTNPSRAKTDTEKSLDKVASSDIKRHIKAEMLNYNVSASIVAQRLTGMGRVITEQGLKNKISKSQHQTTWYWDLMRAIRMTTDESTPSNSTTNRPGGGE